MRLLFVSLSGFVVVNNDANSLEIFISEATRSWPSLTYLSYVLPVMASRDRPQLKLVPRPFELRVMEDSKDWTGIDDALCHSAFSEISVYFEHQMRA